MMRRDPIDLLQVRAGDGMTIQAKPTICIIQPFDPRGDKIGGIESHMRELIRSCPPDLRILLIGIDEIGDLRQGQAQPVEFAGQTFDFMPLLQRTGRDHFVAAKSVSSSLTFNFFLAFFSNYTKIRRLLKGRNCSIELERFEYSTFGRLLGRPTLQMIHGEGNPKMPMDSLLRKCWWLNQLNERVTMHAATRVVAVNPDIVESIRRRFPFAADKAECATVSVNTDLFAEAPAFPPLDPFKIGYAGRLDAVKRPDLMFRVFDDLRRRHGVPIEFHYIGSSDPERYAEFALVRDVTVLHGPQKSENVARLMGETHAGILVSEFEGMPVYVLEMLSVGRPLVVLDLPQMKSLIEDGVSGQFVTRQEGREPVEIVSDAFRRLYDGMTSGLYVPALIRAKTDPYSHHTQLQRLYERHRALQRAALAERHSARSEARSAKF